MRTMAFTTQLEVRFGDEDHARIVYYPRFFHFMHCAFEDFFNHQGHPYRRSVVDERIGWPAVATSADFQSPLRFGDVLETTVEITHIGTSSATFAYRGRNLTTSQESFTGRTTVVCMDMESYRAKPIPERYRALFEKHLVVHQAKG